MSEFELMSWTQEIAFPAQTAWDADFDAPFYEVTFEQLMKGEV